MENENGYKVIQRACRSKTEFYLFFKFKGFKTQNQFFVFQPPPNWHCARKSGSRVASIPSWLNDKESPQPQDGGRIIMTKTKPPNLTDSKSHLAKPAWGYL